MSRAAGGSLVVRASGELTPNIREPNTSLILLSLSGVVAAPEVPRRLVGADGATLQRVVVLEGSGRDGPELRVQIRHAPGTRPLVASTPEGLEVVFAAPEPAPAAGAGPTPAAGNISLAMRDAPLSDLIRTVTKHSDETILMDAEIPKRISIVGPLRYSLAQARAMLDTALLLHGFVAVPMPGGGRKIVPISGAPLPWVEALDAEPGDEPVTTLLHLESIDAQFMLAAVAPLVGSDTVAVVEPSSNGIVMAGSARKIARLRDAMRILDDTGSEQQVIWSLRHRQAGEVLALIEDAFPDDLIRGRADERTNRLILGVRAERVGEIRRLVSRLDREPVGSGELHVLRIQHTDAEGLADIILELRDGAEESDFRSGPLVGREFALEVDEATRSLVLRADPITAQVVADLVAELDVRPPRVRVFVTVAEIFSDDELRLGVDSFIPITTPNDVGDTVAVIATNPSGGGLPSVATPERSFLSRVTRSPVLLPIVDPDGNPVEVSRGSVVITANEGYFRSQTLITPELLVASGEEQEIFSGNNVPVPVAQASSGEAARALETRTNVERRDTGTTLRVKPTVGEQGGVRLELLVEVSALSGSAAGNVERVGPTFTERSIEANVHLTTENAVVIAFATQPLVFHTLVGVPYLSRIPLLGALFRTTVRETSQSTLLVTVRAVSEREGAALLSSFLEEQYLALELEESWPPAARSDG
jgi:general secretion pathway protein D